jgi:hypothetical protein
MYNIDQNSSMKVNNGNVDLNRLNPLKTIGYGTATVTMRLRLSARIGRITVCIRVYISDHWFFE